MDIILYSVGEIALGNAAKHQYGYVNAVCSQFDSLIDHCNSEQIGSEGDKSLCGFHVAEPICVGFEYGHDGLVLAHKLLNHLVVVAECGNIGLHV